METFAIYSGLLLCAAALAVIVRHDWLRLTRPSRRVSARVSGHRRSMDDDGTSWAATYRFSTAEGEFEVVDQVYGARQRPEEGTVVELAYPEGRPDLARPPRVLLWVAVYGVLLLMTGLLVAKAAGMLDR